MEPLKIATVQFETRDNDKVYNLSIIREMIKYVTCMLLFLMLWLHNGGVIKDFVQ